MNNQSPLVPQGSLVEQKTQNRARVKIAVFVVLAIHGVGLLALLMQGCKKQADATAQTDATNNLASTLADQTNPLPAFTNETVALTTNRPAATEPAVTPSQPLSTPTEYKVAKGDTLSSIAPKLHISLKALTDANPGVEPAKLRIGQTLHVPAATASAMPNTGSTLAMADVGNGQSLYSVKSGDNLIKIASQFGTTVKALRAANDLKTDRIVVGQKLRIPSKATATNPLPTAPPDTTPGTTTAANSGPVLTPVPR
jgi:LysM repeat protein